MDIEVYYGRIYRYCYYKVNNKALAEDLTQETFLKFLQKDSREPERYLYTIARNLCIDTYRKKSSQETGLSEAEESGAQELQTSFEGDLIRRLDIRNALEGLTEEEREILILRYVSDVSMGDISKLMGLSRFALYRRLQEAVRKLKHALGKEEP